MAFWQGTCVAQPATTGIYKTTTTVPLDQQRDDSNGLASSSGFPIGCGFSTYDVVDRWVGDAIWFAMSVPGGSLNVIYWRNESGFRLLKYMTI